MLQKNIPAKRGVDYLNEFLYKPLPVNKFLLIGYYFLTIEKPPPYQLIIDGNPLDNHCLAYDSFNPMLLFVRNYTMKFILLRFSYCNISGFEDQIYSKGNKDEIKRTGL